jgi:uncharacterized protein YgbK (DUF1537 family)
MVTPQSPSDRSPVLGCIADDVTGATDLAINLVQGGLRVVQILDVPDADLLAAAANADAIVVALKTRSIPRDDAISQSLRTLHALQKAGITRFYFKYCSTFDSTERGNIGPVAEALMGQLGVEQTIFCPAFPRAGRTVYQGHLFVGDQLLCESGMQNHPLNPMTDANLVRFLAKQATGKVGLLAGEVITGGESQIAQRWQTLGENKVSLVVTDACSDAHLATLAGVFASLPLVTGGSGLARFLPSAYRQRGILASADFVPCLPQVRGRSLIVAGSCSAATKSQVEWMRNKCPSHQVDVAAVIADSSNELAKVRTWAEASDASHPLLVASTDSPESVALLQDRFGVEPVASAIEDFLASVSKLLVDELDVRRLVLAGGETSGAIVRELGIRSLHIGPEICAGVPWTQADDGNRLLALALKSGNFGGEDFFETALTMLS